MPRLLNDTLSIRLPASERKLYEQFCGSIGPPAIGVSEFLRVAARLAYLSLRTLQGDVTSLLLRQHGDDGVALMMVTILEALIKSASLPAPYSLVTRRYAPKETAATLWHYFWAVAVPVVNGSAVRWGVSPLCRFCVTFTAAMGSPLLVPPALGPRAFARWAEEHGIGQTFVFGARP
jgi:hypothetical protein